MQEKAQQKNGGSENNKLAGNLFMAQMKVAQNHELLK